MICPDCEEDPCICNEIDYEYEESEWDSGEWELDLDEEEYVDHPDQPFDI